MQSSQFRLKLSLVMFLGTLVAGTFGFMAIEGMTPADAAYYCVVTVSTVGIGVLHATTPTGKLMTVILIVFGLGSFLLCIASAADLVLGRRATDSVGRKQALLRGLFFSELGTLLMAVLAGWDEDRGTLEGELQIDDRCTPDRFAELHLRLDEHAYQIDKERIDFFRLHQLLADRRDLVLRLLEHPSVVEGDELADILQAIFHVYEELSYRVDINQLAETDREHLVGDAGRIYRLLVALWLTHVEHLRGGPPYLFMFAVAMNPFRRETAPNRHRVAV